MGRQYPIWVDVQSCIYNSSKSYGAKDTNIQRIYVGSSSENSHELANIVNHRKRYSNYYGYENVIVFRTKVDGIVLKELIFEDNDGKAGKLLKERSALTRMKGLSREKPNRKQKEAE